LIVCTIQLIYGYSSVCFFVQIVGIWGSTANGPVILHFCHHHYHHPWPIQILFEGNHIVHYNYKDSKLNLLFLDTLLTSLKIWLIYLILYVHSLFAIVANLSPKTKSSTEHKYAFSIEDNAMLFFTSFNFHWNNIVYPINKLQSAFSPKNSSRKYTT
jgi:hypothetical protein